MSLGSLPSRDTSECPVGKDGSGSDTSLILKTSDLIELGCISNIVGAVRSGPIAAQG